MNYEEINSRFQWVRELLNEKDMVRETFHCLNFHINQSDEALLALLVGEAIDDDKKHLFASTFLGDDDEILGFLLSIIRNEVFQDELIEQIASNSKKLVVEVELDDDVIIPDLPDITFKKLRFLGRGRKGGVRPTEKNPYGVKAREEKVSKIVFVFGRDITASDYRCLFLKSIYPS